MMSVMNNFESNQGSTFEEIEPRVSNNESVDDLTLNEENEPRVSSVHDLGNLESETEVTRVLPGVVKEGGDSRVLDGIQCREIGDSVENGLDCDRGIEFRAGDEEYSDAQNEIVNLEAGFAGREDRIEGGSASSSDDTNEGNHRPIGNNGVVQMDGTVGDFRLEGRSDLRASSGSSDAGLCDSNVVIRSRSMKVLDTDFEMGDMVWGKVKSHPWWPGHIFHEAFAFSSVRRTRREGHVLVAFFGDSSYGWFHPSDLIHYDPHFNEKSQQTNSRAFMKAVEESVDEASRRSALGLSCRCRNPSNFRPTNIPGYLAVDVVDYEPDAMYSLSRIQKARESFQPAVTLSFIKQLAAAPRSGESKSLDFIKHKATALAYRRSIFEEFDETYAQAFGHEPVQSSSSQIPQPPTDKEPCRAPLSGPLVIAETRDGQKSSIKATKPKDMPKRDRYLFKRRDESRDSRLTRINQVHASSSPQSAYEDRASDSAAASYMLQKRDTTVSMNDGLGVGGTTGDQVATSSHHVTTEDGPSAGLCMTIGPDVSGERFSLDATSSLQQLESSALMASEATNMHAEVPDNNGLLKKKKKAAKRSANDQSSEKFDISEKKKKLRKTDGERSMEHLERLSPVSGGTCLAKPEGCMQSTAPSREESQVNNWKKDDEVNNSVPQQGLLLLEAARELPQMLADLQGLALNPFHDAKRKKPAILRKLFLKFRSLVFLKASSAFTTAESESSDAEIAEKNATMSSKTASSLKPSKLSARPEDLTKGGRKRLPSERQEEISAKRLKKITEVKSLGAEKKALLKNAELTRAEGKAKVSGTQQPSSKPMKPERHAKQVDDPPKVQEPTYLLMKFPSGSSLPSLVELKAKFTRFGPLDTSLSRVFYTTNSCRVAFLYRQDANVAYRYAVGSKSVFSNVKFMLKTVSAPEPQQPSGSRSEGLPIDPSSNCDSSAVEPQDSVPATPQAHQQPAQQLKSCLRKPLGGDEPLGPTNGGGTVRAARVRFNMAEDKGGAGNRGDVQMQVESENAIPSSEAEGGPSCPLSSSVAVDVSINQGFMSSVSMQPPPLPHPPHFPRAAFNHPQNHVEVPQRNNVNHNLTATAVFPGLAPAPRVSLSSAPPPSLPSPPPPPPPPSMDISQQMMNLLTRCHGVVTNVKSILGYVPYHPL